MKRRLVLCSTSRYRGELLQRLRLLFTAEAPEIDESPRPGESAPMLAERLAASKAQALAARHADALLIGSDQVAECERRLLGKPLQRDRAIEQLSFVSGKTVEFHTAVAVLDAQSGVCRIDRDVTRVQFRTLQRDEIERYLDLEPALDCAGSFKSEGLGITLFDAIESRDPTALIGLPLIATARLLRTFGMTIPG